MIRTMIVISLAALSMAVGGQLFASAADSGDVEPVVEQSFLTPRIDGRRLDDITVGLNWHLNPYMRVMFNYVWADLDDVGQTNIFQSRVQFDF